MSEPVAKERRSIDPDEFERSLREQNHHPKDPLAELARLVGETNDPYGDVFAHEAVALHAPGQNAYQQTGRQEPIFGAPTGMSPRLSGDFAAIEAGLRGALSAHPEADQHGLAARETYPQHDQYAPHDQYAHHDQYAQHDQAYLQDHEDQQWSEEPQQRGARPSSRSRRPVYAMVATIAVGVIGIGVAFAYKGASSSPSEIRTISAAAGPTKIQPPTEAASDPTNQDPASLGKNGQPAPTRLVSGEEQPVDISQAVQENASRTPDTGSQGDASNVPVPPSPGQTGTAPTAAPQIADQIPTFGMTDMPAPKKVKVVSVRPDGTILSNDVPTAGLNAPLLEPTDGAPPVAKTSTPTTSTPRTSSTKISSKSAKAKSTSRIAAKPTQVAGGADPNGDNPAPRPARKAKLKHVAAAEPTDLGGTAQPTAPSAGDTDPTASVPPRSSGGFAVQLAAPGSESEARSASSRLAKKFASALDGRRLGFHKALSNGKSVFRVRVGSLSKEDAVGLCEKLKADGGSCFVAKNN